MSDKKLLYITDFAYQAKGRRYHEEDLYLTGRLRDQFALVISDPRSAVHFFDAVDGAVFRNAGPVANFERQYQEYLRQAKEGKLRTYNSPDGRGDMLGKDYLLQLTGQGYPVIPTVDSVDHFDRLGTPTSGIFVVKSKTGADSVGLEFLDEVGARASLKRQAGSAIAQPKIDLLYEVSFYFVDREFQYALYAPDISQRWELEPYAASDADRLFAQQFIEWNSLSHGITRVDGCRAPDGTLLLVELEDLNPFLSIDRLDPATRDRFVENFARSIARSLQL